MLLNDVPDGNGIRVQVGEVPASRQGKRGRVKSAGAHWQLPQESLVRDNKDTLDQLVGQLIVFRTADPVEK